MQALGDVLANTTSVGMAPRDGESPVPASALAGYKLVFDAVYTPLETRLLQVRVVLPPGGQGGGRGYTPLEARLLKVMTVACFRLHQTRAIACDTKRVSGMQVGQMSMM